MRSWILLLSVLVVACGSPSEGGFDAGTSADAFEVLNDSRVELA